MEEGWPRFVWKMTTKMLACVWSVVTHIHQLWIVLALVQSREHSTCSSDPLIHRSFKLLHLVWRHFCRIHLYRRRFLSQTPVSATHICTTQNRVRTDIKMLFPGLSRTCKDQIPGFSRTQKSFSRTFQDMFHSQTWVAWGRKSVYIKSVISVSGLQ